MPSIRFVAEQDGEAERELKARLLARLKKNGSVVAAYLVRVRYGDAPEDRVALALDVEGTKQGELVELVGDEFRKIFKKSESLDILFLTREQQTEAAAVANPFYDQRKK